MKKIIAVVLSIVLLFGILPIGVFSQGENNWKNFLIEKLKEVETGTIDVSEYDITLDEIKLFLSEEIHYHYPEISYYFDVTSYNDWMYDAYYKTGSSKYVGTFKLKYLYDKATVKEMQRNVDEAVDSALKGVKNDWNDLETALYLHDWLCTNFMYDLSLWNNSGQGNHDMYSFLMDGEGVCQAYALSYLYLLRLCDIESYFVMSDEDNHGWNVVKIDGEWYHIDVTHDDPVMNKYGTVDAWGKANHDHFMLSDAELEATCDMHSNWEIPLGKEINCESYEGNVYWKDIATSFIEIDDYWYYIDYSEGGVIKTRDFVNKQRVVEIGEEFDGEHPWMITDNSGYPTYYTGLYQLNGHLFFTDSTTIYCYDTHYGKTSSIYTLDKSSPERFYGIYMNGKTIEYITGKNNRYTDVAKGMYTMGEHISLTDWITVKDATPTKTGEKVKYCYICGEVVESQTIPALGGIDETLLGDSDGNGVVETSDLAVMKLFLASSNKIISDYADMNMDGSVDAGDLAMIKLKLAQNY